MTPLASPIEAATGYPPRRLTPLGGGCVAEVWRADLADGSRVVVKRGEGLKLEAWMLETLAAASDLPVPKVVHADDDVLIMNYIDSDGAIDDSVEAHAADLLAALHRVTAPMFGLERETVIGGLPQPNRQSESWPRFFAEQRLLHAGRLALDRGKLPGATFSRLEGLAVGLDSLLPAPPAPALLHGDLWGGNILTWRGKAVGFIDPAIYFGHPEVELAFTTLFGTFGAAFFERYQALTDFGSGLWAGFWNERRDLYNLYPLLVHSALFGGSYPGAVARILDRFVP
jgi:fructosamine-3-kinase